MAGNSWSKGMKGRGEAGRKEKKKGRGVDSKYNEYTEPCTSLHCPGFLSL